MIKITFLTLVAVVLPLLLWWSYRFLSPSKRLKMMGDKIPGPRSLPIVGNGLLFLKDNHFLRTMMDVCKIYGPVTRIWFGKQLFIFLTDADDIKMLLTGTKNLNKSSQYRFFDSWFGSQNMLTGNEDVWRRHRTLLNPSFHIKVLESFLEIMQSNANVLRERLEVNVDREEFDILQYTEKCSLDIISETAMGVKLETQNSSDSRYLRATRNMMSTGMKRQNLPWLHNEHVFRLSSAGRKYYADVKYTKNFINQIIEERKSYLEKRAESCIEEGDAVRRRGKPFLDFLLLESNFTDQEIENEVQSTMFAGHDTVMTTSAFCLYELSRHPDVQEKVHQEIEDLFRANDKQELSFQDCNQELRYLNNVIKETLRIYTTVPIISREVSEDLVLPSGFMLPRGSAVSIFLYHLHQDEKYFRNPDQFVPERFEKKEDMVDFSFIPFSAGPRICIGQKYAMLEMKIIISTLVRKYKFLPSEKVKSLVIESGAVLRSLNKIPIRLTLREHVVS